MQASEQASGRAWADGGMRSAMVHGLFWLALMNAMGVMLSVLLMIPAANMFLGEWTYGRWMMVHMNLGLYGWCCLPMLALLFDLYRTNDSVVARWVRPVVWLWSASLALGSVTWLNGQTSGKLFLDWSGAARVFFPLSMQALWFVLAVAFVDGVRQRRWAHWTQIVGRGLPLVVLLAIPATIYIASNANLYPHFNPDTGGPTGASQLDSSLGIVGILLALPFAVAPRNKQSGRWIGIAWPVLVAEILLCALINHSDTSHRTPAQYLGLGLMLIWIPLVPLYYTCFTWHKETRRWKTAFLAWWMGLVLAGWIAFLPGVLDRIKFTDALVGHSLTAMAGCLSALLILLMQQMLGPEDAIFRNRRSFLAWNHSVLLYVLLMSIAGWVEGGDPAFTIMPGPTRNAIYTLRILTGFGMLAASLEWLLAAWRSSSSHSVAVPSRLAPGELI
jgi:cytochrome c oxidase cbb3-type subunit 1